MGPPEKLYKAFGETKTMNQWLVDPRCLANDKHVIRRRVQLGATFEEAISKPIEGRQLYEAFGEKKTLLEWSRDRRCTIDYRSLYYRAKKGYDVESILLGKTVGVGNRGRLMEAFGEKKMLIDWANDARCVVSSGVLILRLEKGMGLEEAMTRPGVRDRVIKGLD